MDDPKFLIETVDDVLQMYDGYVQRARKLQRDDPDRQYSPSDLLEMCNGNRKCPSILTL